MSIVIAYNIFLTNPSTPATATPPLKPSQNPNLRGQLRTDHQKAKPFGPPSASPAPTKPFDPNSLAGFFLFFFMIPRLSIPL
jgi:hypothetical protein